MGQLPDGPGPATSHPRLGHLRLTDVTPPCASRRLYADLLASGAARRRPALRLAPYNSPTGSFIVPSPTRSGGACCRLNPADQVRGPKVGAQGAGRLDVSRRPPGSSTPSSMTGSQRYGPSRSTPGSAGASWPGSAGGCRPARRDASGRAAAHDRRLPDLLVTGPKARSRRTLLLAPVVVKALRKAIVAADSFEERLAAGPGWRGHRVRVRRRARPAEYHPPTASGALRASLRAAGSRPSGCTTPPHHGDARFTAGIHPKVVRRCSGTPASR